MSTITGRSIRRDGLNGVRSKDWNLGKPIPGSHTGRMAGTKVPDFANFFRDVPRSGKIVVVHFRHPTKRRTPGRVSSIKFMRYTEKDAADVL